MAEHGDVVVLRERTPDLDAQLARRFAAVEARLLGLLGGAEVHHVGATSVPGLVSKGDLDVQVRVAAEDFVAALAALDAAPAMERNPGAYAGADGCSFDDMSDPDAPVGVHVTVKGGDADEQWVFSRLLRLDPRLVSRLEDLKRAHDGGPMEVYRAAKGAFFEGLKREPRFHAARALPAFPILVPLVVQWGDMDAFQHVNNVVYLRWFETARMALLSAIGFGSAVGVGPILHSQSCRYRLPLYAPDDIVVAARPDAVQDDRFDVDLAVWSAGAGAVAATGRATMVAFDYAGKVKARLPDDVRSALARL